MENRIEASIVQTDLDLIIGNISAMRTQMPFLIKLSDADRKSMQMLDDGRKPFSEKAYKFASLIEAISPGADLIESGKKDLDLYSALSTVENELQQMVEMVRDTKQLAGAETFEIARFIYMKAKMAEKMREPGMKTVVDELGKLYRQEPVIPPKPKN
jgi:hypothetical protein